MGIQVWGNGNGGMIVLDFRYEATTVWGEYEELTVWAMA